MSHRSYVVAVLITLVLSAAVNGQMRRQAPPGMPDYDVAREKTVKGSIVRTYLGPLNELFIVEISVDGGALHLFLGPNEVIAKQTFTFTPGAPIEAIGMPGFKVNGGPALLTRQVTSGKQTLTLRDANGKPLNVP
jgi:hypothetical protein